MRQALLVTLVLVVALGVTSGVLAWTHNEHVHNNTGVTINDVHKVLKGRWIVEEMMTDTFPFTEWEQEFVNGEWETHLRWWGADVPTCQYAHVCFTIVDPVTAEYAPGAQILEAWWSRESGFIAPDDEFVAYFSPVVSAESEIEMGSFCFYLGNFNWQDPDHDSLPAPPIFITDIAVAFVDECIPIEDFWTDERMEDVVPYPMPMPTQQDYMPEESERMEDVDAGLEADSWSQN